jgi:hypothetical protein
MNVEIGTEAGQFLFCEYLFLIFGIVSLQCTSVGKILFSADPHCPFCKISPTLVHLPRTLLKMTPATGFLFGELSL